MALTNLSDVNNQVQKFWSPIFTQELRKRLLIGSLVNRDYEGEIKQGGDTVYVSQVIAPAGESKATSDNTFTPEKLQTARIGVTANRRAIASFEFADIVALQSQLTAEKSEIRDALLFSVQNIIDTYVKTLIVPHADNVIPSIAAMNTAALRSVRVQAGKMHWLKNKQWFGLLDSEYYGDVLADPVLSSAEHNAGDATIVAGEVTKKRMSFNLLEDDGMAEKTGTFFHPDFMHLVIQREVQIKVSDLHANNKLGYLISADVIYGSALGIDGDKKVITVKSTA